jgi:hypothetical protein
MSSIWSLPRFFTEYKIAQVCVQSSNHPPSSLYTTGRKRSFGLPIPGCRMRVSDQFARSGGTSVENRYAGNVLAGSCSTAAPRILRWMVKGCWKREGASWTQGTWTRLRFSRTRQRIRSTHTFFGKSRETREISHLSSSEIDKSQDPSADGLHQRRR